MAAIDEIEKLKSLPPMTQQVCGSCRFYQRRKGYLTGGLCDAVGGTYAAEAWNKCQGNRWWQPRISRTAKLRRWLASRFK